MNPFEQPNSSLEKPTDGRGIQWFTIVLAVSIFFITELFVRSGIIKPDINLDRPQAFSWYMLGNLIAVIVLIFAPWLTSAILLALRVKVRRLLHVLLYSVTLTLVYVMGRVVMSMFNGGLSLDNELLEESCSLFIMSIVTATIVMAPFHVLQNMAGQRKSQA